MYSVSVQFRSREGSCKTMIHQLMKKQKQCDSHKQRGQEAAPQLVGTVMAAPLGPWAHTPAAEGWVSSLSHSILSICISRMFSQPQRHQASKNSDKMIKWPYLTLKCFRSWQPPRICLHTHVPSWSEILSDFKTLSSKKDFCRKRSKKRKFCTVHMNYPKAIWQTCMVAFSPILQKWLSSPKGWTVL